jgi:putative ABC transport system permease protein
MRKTFLKKGIREIWAHKFQYFFLVLVLGLGVAAYGSLYDMAETRGATLKAVYEESRFMDIQVMIDYGNLSLKNTINLTELDTILSDPRISSDIQDVEYRLTFDVILSHGDGDGIKKTRGLVMGQYVFDDDGEPREQTVNQPLYYVDDPPFYSAPKANEVFVEHKFADAYGLREGDNITILKGPQASGMTVLEHANIPEYFFVVEENSFLPNERSLGVILMPIDTAVDLLFEGEMEEVRVNDIVFVLKDYDKLDEFTRNVKDVFQENGQVVKTIQKEENSARRFLYDDYENDKQNVATFPIIIFTVSGFGLIMTLRRMIRTHRTQIGIFKSLGVPNRVVLTYFMIIGLIIAVLGLILGGLLSIPLRYGFLTLINNLLGFAIVRSSLSVQSYVIAGAISVVLALSCTIIPAWFALRIKPVDAIQTREGISKKKAGRIATRIGRTSKVPVPLKLTIRNLLRKPGRSFTTIVGVALSLSLFLSFMIALYSITVIIDDNLASTTWDYEIVMDGPTPMNWTDQWEDQFPEIALINHGFILPSNVKDGGGTETGIIYALTDIESAFKMELSKGSILHGQVVISEFMSDKLGVSVGDNIVVEIPVYEAGGSPQLVPMDFEISGIHSNHMGYFIFMDLESLHSVSGLWGLNNIIYLEMEEGEKIQELENLMITTPGVASVTHVDDRENVLDQYFEIFVGTVYIMGLISVILSSAIVYNLFMIDAHEKRRDYATMKTLGTSMRRIGYLIFIESFFVLVLGVALGALGGLGIAHYMFAVADEWEAMNIDVHFTWAGFIGGSVMIAVVIFIVSLLSIRYIRRINIADVIRERSY